MNLVDCPPWDAQMNRAACVKRHRKAIALRDRPAGDKDPFRLKGLGRRKDQNKLLGPLEGSSLERCPECPEGIDRVREERRKM